MSKIFSPGKNGGALETSMGRIAQPLKIPSLSLRDGLLIQAFRLYDETA